MNSDQSDVFDRATFISFVDTLRNQLISGDTTFTNVNLPDFLEALSSYTEDIQGYYDNTGQPINANEPGWKVFADILKGASMYE